MAAGLDPFDVEALEKSVNDSAVRVSTVWVSFLVFGLYLVVAVGNVTHRQLLFEDPVKLPVLNIDLPLVGFFFLAPVLFVILHGYVLVQVLLLARTAAAYNGAVERSVLIASDRARVRQRLANTLFAQMFAGSPREREGLLGALLRLIAWATLAIAPVLVLLAFEVRFSPYHSSLVTWSHRALIAVDLAGVLLLWRGILDAQRDITWRGLVEQRTALVTAIVVVLFSVIVVTFPGEQHTRWPLSGTSVPLECKRFYSVDLFTDSLSLPREVLIDTEKLAKIEAATRAIGQYAHEGERTRHFEGRDLSCGRFVGADLRRVDFSGDNTQLRGADLRAAQLQGANLRRAQLQGADLTNANLQGADLSDAQLQGANLESARLQGAALWGAQLQGADLVDAQLQDAGLGAAQLQGANLREAQLQGADLINANFQGADLSDAQLQGADLSDAQLQGAALNWARLQGAELKGSILTLADLSGAYLWRASVVNCEHAHISEPHFDNVGDVKSGLEGTPPDIDGFIERTVRAVPESAKWLLKKTLKDRLGADSNHEGASEQVWRACAGKVWTSYERSHAAFLVAFVCNPEFFQKDATKYYLVEGFIRNWARIKSNVQTQALARGLLGLDGSPCPGAKELDERTKEKLGKLVETKPAN